MLKASVWMIALRWAIRAIGLVSTIILARLLVPDDFGIVAMAMVVVGMLEILNQTGQKLAIIRHEAPTRAHYDTAWTISVIVGLMIGATILLIAPLTRIYFHEPRAVGVMQWLALRAAVGGFENIGVVNFRRDLQFDRFFLYNVYPKIASFCITVALAILWRSYWALVVGMVSAQVALVITSYIVHPYRPRFSLAKLGEIYSFSGWTLFRTIGIYLNSQIDQIAIGGALGTSRMGRYAVAADVASSPIDEINGPMVAVLYPVMSRVQQDPAELRNLYLRTLCWSAIICASVSVGVTMVAHDMVRFVLGEKWASAEPLIGWLALSAGLLGLSSGAYTAFDAIGKPHLGARMQWVRLGFLAAAMVPVALLAPHSRYFACARALVTAAFMPTLLFAVGREIGVSGKDYFRALWRPLLSASAMAAVLYPANRILAPGNLRLAIGVVLGVFSFTTVLIGLWAASRYPEAPERDLVASLLRLLRPGNAGPRQIHIISKFGNAAGGSEHRAMRLAEVLRNYAEVRLWATHTPDPALQFPMPITVIDVKRLCFPISGTFVFVGAFLHVGTWFGLARPNRRILVFNTDSPDDFARILQRISPRPEAADCEIVYSSEALQARFGTLGTVENSPIDLRKFSPAPARPERPFTIGRLSRDYRYKFHEDDPELFRLLGDRGYCVRILGGTCIATELAGARNVKLIRAGTVAAPEFLRSLDCFIYRTSTTWFESYGRVVLEAMASGLPILCNSAGGYAKHIEHGTNGFFFSSHGEALEIIRRLKSDPGLRAYIGENARKTAEQIYSAEYERRLVEFYTRGRSRELPRLSDEPKPAADALGTYEPAFASLGHGVSRETAAPTSVCLYAPIATAREHLPLVRSRLGHAKAAALRVRDSSMQLLFGSRRFNYHAWRRDEYTNRGDIAIREAVRQLLGAKLGPEADFFEVEWGALDENVLAEVNRRADLFVICGGGFVSADARTGAFSARMNDAREFSKVACPVVAFGIGYNSVLEGSPDERIAALPSAAHDKLGELLRSSRRVGVRDAILYDLLGGPASRSVSLIGDPALFLDQVESRPERGRPAERLQIGLNFALHGRISAGIFQAHFDQYVAFLQRIQRSYPVDFHYFTHCDTERMAVKLLRRHGFHLRVIDLPPRMMLGEYARMDAVVCQMLHSSILATNAGVPSMNIAYDVKNISFYQLLACPDFCIPHDDITQERLWATFTRMLAERTELAGRIGARKALLLNNVEMFLDEVLCVLRPEPPTGNGEDALESVAL